METTPQRAADAAALDQALRAAIYDHFVLHGCAPQPAALAARHHLAPAQLAQAYQRLAEQRAVVLDAAGAIAMAIPFSAHPTDVRVEGAGVTWWANCAFDGLGIPAMLGCDADVITACPHSGAPIQIALRDGAPAGDTCALHMAVPLRQWWDNIADT